MSERGSKQRAFASLLGAAAQLRRSAAFKLMILLFVMLLSQATANPSHGELFQSDQSECGIVAEHYHQGDPDQEREIWLRFTESSEQPTLLTTYMRNAEVIFSQNCSMIALNDNLGSNVSEVRLFRRATGLTYKVLSVDVAAQAWEALARMRNRGKPLRLGHDYVNAIGWSADSSALLLRLWGHTDLQNHVDDWYCVYDVGSGHISTDLLLMNSHSIVIEGKWY